jgi:hypothetical protein
MDGQREWRENIGPSLHFQRDRMGEEILVFNAGRYRSRTFIHNLVNRSGAISYIFANFSFDSAHIPATFRSHSLAAKRLEPSHPSA